MSWGAGKSGSVCPVLSCRFLLSAFCVSFWVHYDCACVLCFFYVLSFWFVRLSVVSKMIGQKDPSDITFTASRRLFLQRPRWRMSHIYWQPPKRVFGHRTAKSRPTWIKFSTHLLLYGIHLWADLNRDRLVGGSRPNQNDCFL